MARTVGRPADGGNRRGSAAQLLAFGDQGRAGVAAVAVRRGTQFGSELSDIGTGLALDATALYVVGALHDTDAFVAKLAKAAPPTIADLIADVRGLGLQPGVEAGLLSKLRRAQAVLETERASACRLLAAFASEVVAQSGRAIETAAADGLLSKTDALKDEISCPA